MKSAEKAVLDQTLNHDCFYILILKIVTLQCGKISFAPKLDTGKDSAVKVPEVSLFLLYKNRDVNTTSNLKQSRLSGVCGWPCVT